MTVASTLTDRLERLDPARFTACLAISLLLPFAAIAIVLGKFFGGTFVLAPKVETFLTPTPFSDRPPLADAANWAAYSLTHSPYGPLALHIAAAIATFVLGAVALHRVTGSNRAVAWFYLFFASHVLFHFEVFTLRDTIPFSAFLMAFVYSATLRRPSMRAAAMGVAAGLGWMTRATGVLFIPWIVILAWSRRGTLSLRLKEIALAILVFVIVSSPWQAAIMKRQGSPSLSPFPGNGIYNAVKGNNELTAGIYPWLDIDYLDQDFGPFLEQEYAGFTATSVIEYAERRPLEFLTLQFKKIVVFLSPLYTPLDAGEVAVDNGRLVFKNLRLVTYNATLWPVYPLTAAALIGFVAFVFHIDRTNVLDVTIACVVALFVLLHFLIWMETRLRLPVDPVLFLGSALYFHRRLS